jgi:hypothetical protein
MSTVATRHAKITVRGLKVSTLVAPDVLPADLVNQPGDPVIELVIDGSDLVVWARINPKSYRKVIAAIAEHGPGNVNVLLQGNLKAGEVPGGPWVLDCAGLSAMPKTPKAEAAAP